MSRFDNIFEYDSYLAGTGLRIGIVMGRFNLPVCEGLLSACVAELKRLGVADADMAIASVPGAATKPCASSQPCKAGDCCARQPANCAWVSTCSGSAVEEAGA